MVGLLFRRIRRLVFAPVVTLANITKVNREVLSSRKSYYVFLALSPKQFFSYEISRSSLSYSLDRINANFNRQTKATMASTSTSSPLPPEVKAKLDQVVDAKIDPNGKFKYILIKVFATDKDGKHNDENSKLVVRGRADCPFHGDILDKFEEETAKLEGIDNEILGGGRILRQGNKISVFGYSQGYGKADHTLTVAILKLAYPTHEITWSDEGY